MKSATQKIIRAAALLFGLQFLTHIAVLIKQLFIAAHFGTSAIMDAYLIAMTVVGLIQLWFAIPVKQMLVPIFRYDLTEHGERRAWANASVLFNNFVIVLIGAALLGGFLAPYLVGLIAPGFEAEMQELASMLTRITIGSLVFWVLGKMLTQFFFSHGKFFLPGTMDLVDNLTVIAAFLILSSMYGIYGLAIAVVLGAACGFLTQLPILWEKRKLYSGRVDFQHVGTREMSRLSLPLFIANGSSEISRITNRIFASLLPTGSLAALSFGHQLIEAPMKLLLKPLQQSTFPHFSKLGAEKDFSTLSSQHARYVRSVFFLTLPLAVGIMVTAEPLVRIIYQRGAFDETSVRLTSQALMFYALGLPALTMSKILNRTFYSLKDSWTPTKATLLSTCVRITLSWILLQPLAHMGLALAESISVTIQVVFLFAVMPEALKGEEIRNTLQSFVRTLMICVLMGGMLFAVRGHMAGASIPLELVSLVLLGVVAYTVLTFVFHREEVQTLLRIATAFRRKAPVSVG